jgi:DNA polymerase (family 10)
VPGTKERLMKNLEIAKIFRGIAQILEIKGDNPFRIRAYEKAAQNIEGLTEDIELLIKEERLEGIPGIGKDLAEKIKEIVKTGRLKQYEELKKSIPEGLTELLNIPGVGPRTAKLLYEELKIKNVSELEKKAKEGRLLGLPGIKEKTVENILKGIELLKRGRERIPLAQAIALADVFLDALKKIPEVNLISPAGSLRRKKETIRDIDILVTSERPDKIMDVFTRLPIVKEILAKGETKSSVLTKDDIQVDVRVVEPNSFGAALLYFTGSKNFNIKLRQLALKRNLKINEYGVFDKREKWLVGKTEEEIFEFLKLSYIVPELREDTGEIEAALENRLPKILELSEIKGDIHVHSKWSDGGHTISEIVEAAKRKGYSYVAITDHSQSLKVAGGVSVKDMYRKKDEIQRLNKKLKNFRVLFGTEVDIDSEGNLDYKDDLLKECEVVIAAIHTGFKQSKEQLTRRIIKACQNKYVHIIAHPTGRLWGTRDAYEIDFEEILKVCKDNNKILEINAFPQRLDLNDINSRRAKEFGVLLAIGTDAHTISQLDTMDLGVSVARRGWLTKEDIINTLTVEELLKTLKR